MQSGARLGNCAANAIEPVANVLGQVPRQPVPANCKSANMQSTDSQPAGTLASVVPTMSCKRTTPNACRDEPLGDVGAMR